MNARRLILMAGSATAAWLSAGSAEAGGTRASGQVVFFPNVANLVPGTSYNKQVPSVRPSLVLMFQDGSWVIKKLRWSSWGGPVARASGISSASNCVPDCAGGKRTNDPVQFVLSRRRHLFGRTVYACYQLTDPNAPPIDQRDCLKHSYGNQYYYFAPRRVATPPLRIPLTRSQDLVRPQRQPRRQGGRLPLRRQPVHRRSGVLRQFAPKRAARHLRLAAKPKRVGRLRPELGPVRARAQERQGRRDLPVPLPSDSDRDHLHGRRR